MAMHIVATRTTGRIQFTDAPFYMDEIEISAVYTLLNQSVFGRLMLQPNGFMRQWNWINRTQGWFMYASVTTDSCERYALCGVHGICDIGQSPNCGCLRGFTPKNPDQWNMADWTSGCQRETPLDCGVGEGFRKYSFVKIPDTGQSWFDRNMSLEQCKVKCASECNCTAHATLDIKQGTGCLVWYNELIDMRTLPNRGQDIYIRMSATELEKDQRSSKNKKKPWAIIIPVGLGLVILLGVCVMIILNKKKKKVTPQGTSDPIVQNDGLDLPLFNLSTLIVATDNFSSNNKLGEGGFGPVYKGCLEDGQEIALKRLSVISAQGVEEFRNEVIFISKLQHRNLVKILGYCVEGTEKC
ncbi:G-type lectin S-receptor-like serine/threonine-protein kinase At4g27290 [Bidens hawaiensis]|uniref:G-type lectin S-receptor-like serine/threonine-protein kinase At4g27290 n=1 Tax=Bidens hawaiensis TaxID=980011 RepID=UPI00404AF5A8